MRIRWTRLLPICITLQLFASDPIIGVLESPQDAPKAPQFARILFVKRGCNWIALNDSSRPAQILDIPSVEWSVVLGGLALGSIHLKDTNPEADPKEWAFERDRKYEPVSEYPLPAIANSSESFGGWLGIPATRPLLLSSKPFIKKSSGWKAFTPASSFKNELLLPLRKSVGSESAIHCQTPDSPARAFRFKAKDLVIYKGFKSEKGQMLVSIGINRQLYGCDGPQPPEWSANWFLFANGTIRFLGNEMELVEVGDFDNDGRPEFLFWHSGYDQDGYLLLYDGFQQQSTYYWSYH